DEQGRLQVMTPLGSVTEEAPYAYQEIEGRQVPIIAAYVVESGRESAALGHVDQEGEVETATISFRLGPYDPSFPLVIDPAVLLYAGLIGGTGNDDGFGVGVDAAGNAYVVGSTSSPRATFPATVGPDLTYHGNQDAFVAKVRADGSGLVYAGYLGGDSSDAGS